MRMVNFLIVRLTFPIITLQKRPNLFLQHNHGHITKYNGHMNVLCRVINLERCTWYFPKDSNELIILIEIYKFDGNRVSAFLGYTLLLKMLTSYWYQKFFEEVSRFWTIESMVLISIKNGISPTQSNILYFCCRHFYFLCLL